MVVLHLIMRGISGVGKSTLMNKLIEQFELENTRANTNFPIYLVSKDIIRKLTETMNEKPYKYTPEEEQDVLNTYAKQVSNSLKTIQIVTELERQRSAPFEAPGVLISDNTHTTMDSLRKSQFVWDWTENEEKKKELADVVQVILQVGDENSPSQSTAPLMNNEILNRQRKELAESALPLQQFIKKWRNPSNTFFMKVPAHCAENPRMVQQIYDQLLNYCFFKGGFKLWNKIPLMQIKK